MRIFLLFTCVFFAALSFTACSDDGDNNQNELLQEYYNLLTEKENLGVEYNILMEQYLAIGDPYDEEAKAINAEINKLLTRRDQINLRLNKIVRELGFKPELTSSHYSSESLLFYEKVFRFYIRTV